MNKFYIHSSNYISFSMYVPLSTVLSYVWQHWAVRSLNVPRLLLLSPCILISLHLLCELVSFAGRALTTVVFRLILMRPSSILSATLTTHDVGAEGATQIGEGESKGRKG